MKNIIVLGSGCTQCVKTAEIIEKIAQEVGADASLSKETSPEAIMFYSVMSTLAAVIDGTLIDSGSIPHRDQIKIG